MCADVLILCHSRFLCLVIMLTQYLVNIDGFIFWCCPIRCRTTLTVNKIAE